MVSRCRPVLLQGPALQASVGPIHAWPGRALGQGLCEIRPHPAAKINNKDKISVDLNKFEEAKGSGIPGKRMRVVTEDDLALARFYRWERERGSQIFLTQPFDGGKVRDWTWAQAGDEARRVAVWLQAQNWEPGSRVAILSRNCAWWLMADLAIWMAGHVSVPIYPSLNWRTILNILEHSDAKACFLGATDEHELTRSGIPAGVVCVRFPTAPAEDGPSWDSIRAANEPMPGRPLRAADELATIIYTSGTTGTPKGVMHRFSDFMYFAAAGSEWLGLNSGERLLSYLPLAHIVERSACEALGIYLGFRIFFTEGLETFLTDLQRAQPTLFPSVPRLLLKFQQGVFQKMPKAKLDKLLRIPLLNRVVKKEILTGLGLSHARLAASGAAPLPIELLLWYRNLGLNLFEGYGMTETGITHIPRPGRVRPGYVGPAVEGVEQRITESGELLVKSPMNMMGYFKDPQGTESAFTEDGFFRTGDLVQCDPDGQVKIIGRVKEQFKTSKGKYVAPAPIEGQLMAYPAVEACCVMGAGLPSPFVVIVLAAEARENCTDAEARKALEQALIAQMEQVNVNLDPHERMNLIAIADGPWSISNGLLTPTLKIKRTLVEHRYLARLEGWERQKSPIVWESDPAAKPSVAPTSAASAPTNAAS
jgi:long-chain acyl-CoA synthetase